MNALSRKLVSWGLVEPKPGWFEVFIEHLRAFEAEHGHCRVPTRYVGADGYKLGQKTASLRSGNFKITDGQRAILDAEGFVWNAKNWWPVFIEHFRAFRTEHGHCKVPYEYVCSDGYKLRMRVNCVRSGNNKITDGQRAILDAEGFVWNASPTGAWWSGFIARIRAFVTENGHCRVIQSHVCPDGYPLGKKVASIRHGRTALTPEWRKILDAEGFVWNVPDRGAWWPEFLEHLRTFKAEHGRCRGFHSYVCPDGYPLEKRVSAVRAGSNRITDEQRAILDAEGFVWKEWPWWPWWPPFLEHLRIYKVEHGHCRVIRSYVCPDGYPLGARLPYVRSGNNKTTDEQRTILDAEGFVWDTSDKGAWWPEFIEHLRAFETEHGHCRVPARYVGADGYKLGRRVNGIRSASKFGQIDKVAKITDDQRAILDAEGFVWNARLNRGSVRLNHE